MIEDEDTLHEQILKLVVQQSPLLRFLTILRLKEHLKV